MKEREVPGRLNMLSDFAGLVKAGTREERLLGSIAWDRLPRHVAIIMAGNVRKEIEKATERTAKNTGMILAVALNYGGRAEIVDACRAAVRRLIDEGNAPDELTEERVGNELYTRTMPDLDLLVRTSGELRISNFLLWQAAYSEIYVTETLWPDFRRVHLLDAIVDYQARDRRFGGLKLVANAE